MLDDDSQAQQGHLGADEGSHQEPVVSDADTSGGKLYAGKYGTPEELESAHRNLEAKLGQMGNELGSLRQFRERFEQTLNPQTSPQDAKRQMMEAFEADPVAFIQQYGQGIMQQVQTATEQKMSAQMAVNDWLAKPENAEFRDPRLQKVLDDTIRDAINTNPETAYLPAHEKLNRAGKLVKDYLKEKYEEYQKAEVQRNKDIQKMAAMETGQPIKPGAATDNKEPTYDSYMESRRKQKEALLQRE